MKRRRYLTLLFFCAMCAGPALAEGEGSSPAPFPEFTFKRIGLPQAGGSNLITVQIDPATQMSAAAADTAADTAAGDEASPVEEATSAYDWFWAEVSSDAVSGGPANLNLAMAALRENQANPVPRLQNLQDIAANHGMDILRATVGTSVSPALVVAVISVESGGDADAISSAGASGIMQLIPATAERFGVEDTGVAAENIKGGVAYLAWLMETFSDDTILALAGYNAGENAVRNHGGVPPYSETRAYIPRVLTAWRVARGLCQTPPELITDGCVFAMKGSPSNG
ncbi:MAG: lytic transglycosylase domain-containing protein [Rhodobacteraceae bacterium]|nr:lytic transglycosylase domain-containing protein [Paracoccaceae bacterium]